MKKYQVVIEKWDICKIVETNWDHTDALEKVCQKFDSDCGAYSAFKTISCSDKWKYVTCKKCLKLKDKT